MAPRTRSNPKLKQRIARLKLSLQLQNLPSNDDDEKPWTFRDSLYDLRFKLCPIYPQPHGLPHPNFPKTILHYNLLTEDELDEIAHYYDQSTPGPYTDAYPKPMGWDADFLARNDVQTPQLMPWDPAWLAQYNHNYSKSASASTTPISRTTDDTSPPAHQPPPRIAPFRNGNVTAILTALNEIGSPVLPTPPPLTTAERIAIKRRKLGKFMGLRDCETPREEMHRRVRFLEARLRRGMRQRAARRDSADRESGRSRYGPRIGKDLL